MRKLVSRQSGPRPETVISILLVLALLLCASSTCIAEALWVSPDRYRVALTVNPGGVTRKYSPVSFDLDLQQLLAANGSSGEFDEFTVEVVGYDALGQPRSFDASRAGYEKYLVPHRIRKYLGIDRITLSFVMTNEAQTTYHVYFDTVESGLGKPDRYPGLVGDGDHFREEYKRREINACHLDHFVDFDGDGDLDLFKAGVEPWVYCYENVGGNRMVDRGRLTSGGNLFTLPASADSRSWMSVAFYDWDGDGDLDFFPSFSDGPDAGKIVFYKNTTAEAGGVLTYTRIGPLMTITGTQVAGGPQAGGIFPSICFVDDWDGNGDAGADILVGSNNHCYLYRSQGRDANGYPRLADAVAVQAGGSDIVLTNPRYDVADIDSDGDLDLFAGCQEGPIYWFRNIGTRTLPVFAAGVVIAYPTPYYIGDAHSGVKVADWDGNGLLDIVAGRYWERTPASEAALPRYYGGLHKNVGTPTASVFERRDEYNGSPYTERFQQCDAVRQNGVRTVDWNNDGRPDLIAGDTDGFVWYFRNLNNRFFPVFATGQKLYAGGQIISLMASGGHARPDICDWNNDGKKDLVVADGDGWITLFLNTGTDANPSFGAGARLYAAGSPIDSPGSRSSVLVCDWNNDGKKDVVQGDDTGYYWYKNLGTDASPSLKVGQMITPGGSPVTYTRPNVGSYVDWNGDGKLDFIGCNFENSIRYYENIGTGGVNVQPTFSDPAGVQILRDYSIMMISGADVKDWNGDTDLDILTGQGHGGSGLRYYERDYINDYNNSTFPIVSVGASEHGLEVAEARSLGNGGATILLPNATVTAAFTGYFYIAASDGHSGIKVQKASHGRSVGDAVDVWGVPATDANGERYINASTVLADGFGGVSEIMIGNAGLGGGDAGFNPATGAGQRGVEDGLGANNIGLLVRTVGRCSLNLANPNTGGDYYGAYYLFIDDGAGTVSWYRASDGVWRQALGVKVQANDAGISAGDYVTARGISSIELVNGAYQRRLLPRAGLGDVARVQ
ncbi:MAG: VCBS repeat-containing protein [Armatimonadota bacterium]|nr:VCBS repeat-containing protein [Armatimonadota bacterium]